jgi:hypothetical protein
MCLAIFFSKCGSALRLIICDPGSSQRSAVLQTKQGYPAILLPNLCRHGSSIAWEYANIGWSLLTAIS